MKILIVVDMQRDFVEGPLGNEETRAIVPKVVEKVKEAIDNGVEVWYTYDTHKENYMKTLEGKYLPVPHCIEGTDGWDLIDELDDMNLRFSKYKNVRKPTFGSYDLPDILEDSYIGNDDPITDITLIGVCTDICVISNALVLKSYYCGEPPVDIHVDASCCAGTTSENHKAALQVMKSCQIIVEGE